MSGRHSGMSYCASDSDGVNVGGVDWFGYIELFNEK